MWITTPISASKSKRKQTFCVDNKEKITQDFVKCGHFCIKYPQKQHFIHKHSFFYAKRQKLSTTVFFAVKIFCG